MCTGYVLEDSSSALAFIGFNSAGAAVFNYADTTQIGGPDGTTQVGEVVVQASSGSGQSSIGNPIIFAGGEAGAAAAVGGLAGLGVYASLNKSGIYYSDGVQWAVTPTASVSGIVGASTSGEAFFGPSTGGTVSVGPGTGSVSTNSSGTTVSGGVGVSVGGATAGGTYTNTTSLLSVPLGYGLLAGTPMHLTLP